MKSFLFLSSKNILIFVERSIFIRLSFGAANWSQSQCLNIFYDKYFNRQGFVLNLSTKIFIYEKFAVEKSFNVILKNLWIILFSSLFRDYGFFIHLTGIILRLEKLCGWILNFIIQRCHMGGKRRKRRECRLEVVIFNGTIGKHSKFHLIFTVLWTISSTAILFSQIGLEMECLWASLSARLSCFFHNHFRLI